MIKLSQGGTVFDHNLDFRADLLYFLDSLIAGLQKLISTHLHFVFQPNQKLLVFHAFFF